MGDTLLTEGRPVSSSGRQSVQHGESNSLAVPINTFSGQTGRQFGERDVQAVGSNGFQQGEYHGQSNTFQVSTNANIKKVCAQWRILKPPSSFLATDRSKAVVLV